MDRYSSDITLSRCTTVDKIISNRSIKMVAGRKERRRRTREWMESKTKGRGGGEEEEKKEVEKCERESKRENCKGEERARER